MGDIWITSDLHFNHNIDFIWKERGFSSVEEMNQEIVQRFNSMVKPTDTVFILGDCVMGKNLEDGIVLLKQLNGILNLIIGNHDTDNKLLQFKNENIFRDIKFGDRIKIGKTKILMSHYPTITDNNSGPKVVNFHGHTHTKNKFSEFKCCYHVGVDSNFCYPINIEDGVKEFKNHIFE